MKRDRDRTKQSNIEFSLKEVSEKLDIIDIRKCGQPFLKDISFYRD